MAIRAVISDFGGVLTTPLLHSFAAFQDQTGIEAASLGDAMARIAERDGEHPLYELERGYVSEADFLDSVRRAAWQAGRELQVIRAAGAGGDHPFLAHVPEGRYLKAIFGRVRHLPEPARAQASAPAGDG